MKASKKAKTKLQARQADYDAMIKSASPNQQATLTAAYHRPGSLKG